MKIPDIAFDLDGTLIDLISVFDQVLFEVHGIKIDESRRTRFDLSYCVDLTKNEIWSVIKRAMDRVNDIQIYLYAKNLIDYVYAFTEKPIKIITNRPIDKVAQTYDIVDRMCKRTPYELIINHRGFSKLTYMDGIEFMVEDRRKNAIEFAEAGKTVFLLSRSYNSLPKNTPRSIIVIESLKQVLDYFKSGY
jgi:hypothetical protein